MAASLIKNLRVAQPVLNLAVRVPTSRTLMAASKTFHALPKAKTPLPVMSHFATDAKVEVEEEEKAPPAKGGIADRFILTAEVIVSKIFPAGFGWQGASCIADAQLGYAADSMSFALVTGVGDCCGVITGHTLYYGIKKAAVDSSIDLGAQFQTAVMLGTAAFHAGTAWQPIVNFLHDKAGCTFNETLVGTFAGCGFMFFVGLRVARTLYSGFMPAVAAPAYDNLKADAALSASIGGATACFVGTDISFVANGVDANWLRPVVGIEEGVSDLSGMVSAGTSTGLGFAVTQSVQNVAYPAGTNWTD